MNNSRYVLREGEALDLDAFVELLRKDPGMVADLPEWDDECQGVAEELFAILDRNQDQKLSSEDVSGLHLEDVELWAARAYDRFIDMAEVVSHFRFNYPWF